MEKEDPMNTELLPPPLSHSPSLPSLSHSSPSPSSASFPLPSPPSPPPLDFCVPLPPLPYTQDPPSPTLSILSFYNVPHVSPLPIQPHTSDFTETSPLHPVYCAFVYIYEHVRIFIENILHVLKKRNVPAADIMDPLPSVDDCIQFAPILQKSVESLVEHLHKFLTEARSSSAESLAELMNGFFPGLGLPTLVQTNYHIAPSQLLEYIQECDHWQKLEAGVEQFRDFNVMLLGATSD
ncbi:unnamed protein product [Darwinula stevensoni]|uniref:Uncharacterized protein n=1 Tax=Darwinula stevensoni TaxID=69355 RepID=A0A7R8XE02_9CRUS|nr:unnamed protein product [Darwinula stevensoni]CAG0887291.1 unnamed protein product [Darwinula stevensoni]